MHNLSDEEMDRLSREAAEQHRAPVPPGNWDKLSALLDKEMPVAAPFWKKWVWPLSDLLLLLFLFYAYTGYDSSTLKTNANNIQRVPVEKITEITKDDTQAPLAGHDRVTDQNTGNKVPAVSGVTNDGVHQQEVLKQNQGPSKTKLQDNRDVSLVNPTINGKRNPTAGTLPVKFQKQPPAPLKNNSEDKKLPGKNAAGHNINVQPKKEETGEQIITKEETGKETLKQSAENTFAESKTLIDSSEEKSSVAETRESIIDSADIKTETGGKKESAKKLFTGKKGKWEAGIIYSPDFSQVGNAKAVKNGHNFGIILGYHLDERWSVQTGAVYSRKNYTALGTGYQKVPGYNSYDPNIKVKKVQAECYMWEVPVSIRYNFLVGRSQKAFISAGVSSYFMEKEDLHYWYTYNTNPRYKAWINEKNSSYWFSVAGISAGFEQYITPSISIQAEPFFRFTLKEIGYGYINLKTMGIFLGVKYSPPPRS